MGATAVLMGRSVERAHTSVLTLAVTEYGCRTVVPYRSGRARQMDDDINVSTKQYIFPTCKRT